MSGLVGSNAVIRELTGRTRLVMKTHTRGGVVYHFDDNLKVIQRPVAERLIEKRILVAREESEQSFSLSPEWGGITP